MSVLRMCVSCPPDLTIRDCPNLVELRLEPGKALRVRDLRLEGCPALKHLPTGLMVERNLKAPALSGDA